MSLMAMSAPRSSVFTFESSAHSSHVLRRLDDQRRRDTLCDVTVVVEGQSFRAHRSVLASCSEYFSLRLSSLTQHGAVITLPQEVTVSGFEPLLKFAYTSKLLFGKDSVLDIRNSASVLGFRDLDEACFDFLLPKFFSRSSGAVACPRMTCCERKYKRLLSKVEIPTDSDVVLLDEKEEKPVADSPLQQEVAELCKESLDGKKGGSQSDRGALTPGAAGVNVSFVQCPKYRKFQLACGKDACVTERSNVNNLATVVRDDCNLSSSPNFSCANSQNESEVQIPSGRSNYQADEPWKTEINEEGVGIQEVKLDENYVVKMEEDTTGVNSLDRASVNAVSLGESTVPGERSPGLILHHCPLMALAGGPAITRSLEQERFVVDLKEEKKPVDCGEQEPVHPDAEAWGERRKEGQTVSETKEVRIMERNVESGGSVNVLDSDAGSSSDTGSGQPQPASLEWLKLHVNLSSSSSGGGGGDGGCPFLQDLDQSKCLWKGAGQSESEGASLSGVSSLNSGEDGESETETEGDSESYARERARQVQLPFSVDWIVDLSRNDFQQLLKQQEFTREQLDFVHDMRRRSKNRLAAQRCRKRKLDCIYNLQYEINKLTEREKLMMEKSQLRQMKMKTCHSVSALCQRVCSESNLQPEQLQVLTKSSDCPLSSLFPHIDALLSQRGLQVLPQTSRSVSSMDPDKLEASEEALSSTSRDTREGYRSLKPHTESPH
ncbi:transcription regulator protein BACH1-like isoform X2 [Solea solea]|uniref:transcription regulator protein BACH1-like isoform X2 n=1 Tax=Solea solea TaxID=90069 RepID=UPI00272D0F96|nr:transcription regulator protein BACH1-like isoform X2 [Solea solea]